MNNQTIAKGMRHIARHDPHMHKAHEHWGQPAPRTSDLDNLGALIRIIVGQQISIAVANAIHQRLVDAWGAHPNAAHIAMHSEDELRAFGLSAKKASYIRTLAQRILNGDLNFDVINKLSDDELVERLSQEKGLGVWSAHIYGLFHLDRHDMFPSDDLGMRRGFGHVQRHATGVDMAHPFTMPSPKDLNAASQLWKPYRGVAAIFLWHVAHAQSAIKKN